MANGVILVVREVMAELVFDMQEICTFIFELAGVDDVCGRVGRLRGVLGIMAFNMKPSWMGRLGRSYGCRRSLVRMIGTRLYLKPAKRPHFSILSKNPTESLENSAVSGWCPYVPSLTDALSANNLSTEEYCKLQDDLKQLRSKVASVVDTDNTKRPPPPPPPLPLLPVYTTGTNTVTRRIPNDAYLVDQQASKPTSKNGNMMDILKDIAKIKLRKVERSPGGRPLRLAPPLLAVSMNDPAAILAEALKKRFSNLHILQESFEEDEFDSSSNWDPSPCSSPLRISSHSSMNICLNPVPAV